MPDHKTERDVQNAVIAWAKDRFIQVIRCTFMPGTAAGWPDTIFLMHDGKPAFIEFKRPGKKPTRLQQERITWLEAHGYRVAWFDNADEAKEWLDGLRNCT